MKFGLFFVGIGIYFIYENAVGDTVYYKVNVTIPQVTDMSSYTTLQLKDTLHEALTLNGTPELSGNN